MHQYIVLAYQALENGNPPVGAIAIYSGQIVDEGIEAVKPKNDITQSC